MKSVTGTHLLIAFLTLAISNGLNAEQSGAANLAPNSFLNLETGAVSRAGGDVFWDGVALTPQGSAGLYNLGKLGSRVFKSIRASNASSVSYASKPIPAGTLVGGDIFGVRTNAGHYAKVMVTETNSEALAVQYTVFKPAEPAATSGPAISEVLNNYSYILPGLPNYGIAPGSLFVVFGSGLSSSAPPVLQSSEPPGLPTTLNQTSISVSVNGVNTTPALYYTSATQLAAVLPSDTPVGKGTITVTYNGQTSAPAPIQVVASAVGLDTLYGTGNGVGVATDGNGKVLGLTNSAMPGQTIVLWGSGIGGDPANDDRTYPQKQNNLANTTQVFIGGVSASVLYAGRSQYPGLDQYNVVIPSTISSACFVSVVVQTGLVVSNAVTLPVSAEGGPCSDPATGLDGTTLQSLEDKSGNVNSLLAILSLHTDGSQSLAFALAGGLSGANFGKGYEYASEGSCTVVPPNQGPLQNTIPGALDAGTIQVNGPTGQFSLGTGPGFYQNQFNATSGAYTFSGSGGKDLGSFSVSFNVPTPFTLTNSATLALIDRTKDATVTWSGGFPNGVVQVNGEVGAPNVKFFCYAPTSAGKLVVPSFILLALPPGSGSLVVSNATAAQPITATSLDVGVAGGVASTKLTSTFR